MATKEKIIQIPKQLQKDTLRFCFVNYKVPYPKEWQNKAYKYNDPKLLARINTGGNYGVIGGYGNLMIVDADTQKVVDAFSVFGDTFTIKTGAEEGKHFYFFVPGLNKSYALAQETKESTPENLIFENIGHITSKGRMVVAPGCKHYKQLSNRKFEPTGKKYEVLKDAAIKVITAEQLQAVIKPFTSTEIRKQQTTQAEAKTDYTNSIDIPISIVAEKMSDLEKKAPGYRGHNPDHPQSKSRMDLAIDTKKNWWMCGACASSGYGFGNALYLIALNEGILHCHECKKGGLRGDKFLQVKKLAIEKYGVSPDVFPEKKKRKAKVTQDRIDLLEKHGVYLTKKDKITGEEVRTGRINCILLARAIMDMNYHFKRIVDENTGQDDIIYYRDGYYHLGGEDIAKGEVDEFLKKDASDYRRNEVMKAIKYKLSNRIDRDELEPDPRYINMDNGIYNIETEKIQPHSHDFLFLNKITTKYDPDAECPKIKKFYSQVLYEKDISVKQEEAGLMFYRKHVFERAFVSLGGGANGKGTSEYLFMRAIGRRNYSTRSLTDLTENTFAKAELYAKMANFGGEISSKYMKDSSVLKRITGGEEITAERKGKTGYSFLPYSILCFNANELPKHKDKTYAFYRRWVCVVYPNTFMESDPDTNSNLRSELTTPEELSGFFNWAMAGLKRVLKDGKLTYNDYVNGEPVYDMLSQPESIFIDDYLTNVTDVFLTTDEVYEKYKIWAENRKYQIQSKSLLTQKIKNRFEESDVKVKAKNKKVKEENGESVSKRCYVNLTWTTDEDDVCKNRADEISLDTFTKTQNKCNLFPTGEKQ